VCRLHPFWCQQITIVAAARAYLCRPSAPGRRPRWTACYGRHRPASDVVQPWSSVVPASQMPASAPWILCGVPGVRIKPHYPLFGAANASATRWCHVSRLNTREEYRSNFLVPTSRRGECSKSGASLLCTSEGPHRCIVRSRLFSLIVIESPGVPPHNFSSACSLSCGCIFAPPAHLVFQVQARTLKLRKRSVVPDLRWTVSAEQAGLTIPSAIIPGRSALVL